MIRKDKPLRLAQVCGALLAAALAAPASAQSGSGVPNTAAVPASASSAPGGAEAPPTLRPEIGALLFEAQRLLSEKKVKEAAVSLLAAEAVADKTPYEAHVLARLKGAMASASADAELAAQQYLLASPGPWLSQSDRFAILQTIVSLYYNAKNYTKAIEWIDRYLQAGGAEPGMGMVRAQSYYLKADYANAVKALEVEVAKATSAGKAPAEMQLRLLADARSRVKDEAGYTQAVEMLVQHYPSKDNWRTLMARLWAKPQLAGRLQLDVFRLQLATAGLGDASDFTEMAELALQAGSAIEAEKVLEQGLAAGVLGAGGKPAEWQRLKDKVTRAAAEDRNTLEKDAARARTMPDGIAMFNYGFNAFQLGQTERGVTQMEQGLAKGIARNHELARLRLVAAYAQLGERDKARQLLATLAGKTDLVGLEETARYWNLLLRPS